MENKKGYTDAPSSKDLLKRGDYVQALKKIVTTCDTPMTISITGEWKNKFCPSAKRAVG